MLSEKELRIAMQQDPKGIDRARSVGYQYARVIYCNKETSK